MHELKIREVKRSEINSDVLRRMTRGKTSIAKYFLANFQFRDVGIAHIGVYEPPGPIFIYHLYVIAEYRSMGFGSKLLDTVEQFARENGNPTLELEPGQIDLTFPVSQVEAWYQQRGYQPSPEDVRKYRKYIN